MSELTIPALSPLASTGLAALRERVQSNVRDSEGTFVTPTDIDTWLKEAMQDLSHRLRIVHGEASSAVPAGGKIPVPSDFVEPISLRLGTDDVEWVDDNVWWEYQDQGATPSHPIGRVFSGSLEVYPVPAAGTSYTLRYVREVKEAADLSLLPNELHKKAVEYATAKARWKEGEQTDGDRYLTLYEQGLPAAPLGRNRINPGPMSVSYVPGPFDTDGTHI